MMTSPDELARGALDAAIAVGRVAHHSGAADDLYRRASSRVRELAGLPRYGQPGYVVPVEIHDTADGRFRAIVDTAGGYWDSIIPAAVARRIRERG